MARPQTLKDVEYTVDDANGRQRIFKSSNDGRPVNLDVLVDSPAGARWYRGSPDGMAAYEEDPEASVFDRIVVSAESTGRVS